MRLKLSTPAQPFHQWTDFRRIQEFARGDDTHGLILLPVEVPARGVDGDDEISAGRERALQKTIVWFVANDAEFRQRMAQAAGLSDFSNKFGMITQYVRIFFQHRGTCPQLNQARARQLENERRCVVFARERRELENAGVKNDSQGKAWHDAMPGHVAWFQRTRRPLARSSSCRDFRDARGPTPERV